jgi:hypothetical protein
MKNLTEDDNLQFYTIDQQDLSGIVNFLHFILLCEYVFNCEGQTDVNLSNKTLLEIMDSFEKYKVQDQ